MSEVEEQLEKVEISIETAKQNVSRKDSLVSLTKNTDFNDLIMEGYFKQESSRLVLMKADVNMQSDENQKAVDHAIIAIGNFHQYLNTVMQLGNMAQRAIEDDQNTREELLAENA